MNTQTHVPPHSTELEAAVLGIALQERNALNTILSLLPSEQVFYTPKHQTVYKAIRQLHQAGHAVDMKTVIHQLAATGQTHKVRPADVSELAIGIGSAAHIETHCRIVLEQHARRVVITAARGMEAHGYDESRDALEVVAEAQVQLTQLHQLMETRGAVSAASLLPGVLDRIRRAVGMSGMTGIPTGLTQLNSATGGWQPKHLIVIGARPGMGKTAALLHHAREAALVEGIPTGIFSMEMPADELVERLLATEVKTYSNSDLRKGNLQGGVEEVDHLLSKAQLLANADNLFIDDTPALSLHQLASKAARMVAEHGVRFILVDYLQLMSGPSKTSRPGNREQEISEISRGLKALAKDLNVPVVALAQLSRSVEHRGGEKRPQLSDLRESGAIEQDADMIIFLWRGEYYGIEEYEDGTSTKDTILYDIAKHRGGALNELIFYCRISRGIFSDLDLSPAPAGERPFYDKDTRETVQLGRLPASQFEQESSVPVAMVDDNDMPF
ncbi:replicative DNA helicase [Hymenobacter sp. BT18]|uniref:replicative DNA helicase n=1 Tax=Hymenobacter sp. BT18 TaxID=2835648 RepID=UPI00143E1FEA|nr:replicative DNA helicase [Hymenobacter sp. BT18]QIX61839.1 replicative DNA helicase [Hymenobacter sp. BT18]